MTAAMPPSAPPPVMSPADGQGMSGPVGGKGGGPAARRVTLVVLALISLLAGIAVYAALRLIEQPLVSEYRQEHRMAVLAQAHTLHSELEGRLAAALLVSQALVFDMSLNGPPSADRFTVQVDKIRRDVPYIRNIALAVGTVVRHVAPLEGNQALLGVDYRAVAPQWPDIERAIASRQPVLTGPVPLVQGGTGLIQRQPVFATPPGGRLGEGAFVGLVSQVVNVIPLIEDSLAHRPDAALLVALRRLDDRVVFYGDPGLFNRNPVVTVVSFPGGAWELAVMPAAGWVVGLPGQMLLHGIELLTAGVLALGLYLLLLRHHDRRAQELERLRMLEEIKQAKEELEQVAFAASHDLQTPIRLIGSYLQLLQRRYQGRLDADADTYISYAVEGAQRLRRQVSDLIAFVVLSETGAIQRPVSLEQVLREAVDALTPQIDRAGATLRLPDRWPTVYGDAEQLASLFRHLLENAVRYHRPGVPPQVTVAVSTPLHHPGYVQISVADNGAGIALAHQTQVFLMFRRLVGPDHSPGSGMGLPVCRRIVERHGGRIWLVSEEGVGTTLHVTLPQAAADSASHAA